MKAAIQYPSMLLIGFMLLTSCRTVYAPNAVNVPLLQEKGEFKAAILTNNIQLSTAVTQHFGVMVNGYLNSYTSDDKSFKNNGKGAEIGLGYFGQTDHRVVYEAYGGAGLYNVKMKESNNTKAFDVDAVKYFVQPAIGWANPFFEIAFSPRLSIVKYAKPNITGYNADEQASNYFNIVDQKAYSFLEPTLILRGGYRFVKVQVQYGQSVKLSKNNINREESIGSVGLIFDIANWYQTRK